MRRYTARAWRPRSAAILLKSVVAMTLLAAPCSHTNTTVGSATAEDDLTRHVFAWRPSAGHRSPLVDLSAFALDIAFLSHVLDAALMR